MKKTNISTKILDKLRKSRNSFYKNFLKKPRIYYKKESKLEPYKKINKNKYSTNKEYLKNYRKIRTSNLDYVESLKDKIKSIS